jgi:predicted regulator of Ras-like GTPase activity (Roadblock/LC7/MglB family)
MVMTSEVEERIAKCEKILEVDPNSQIFAALAEAYRKKGDLERAFRICQGGLRVHPSYGSAHVVMAKINLDRGLYDWAEAEVKKSIELEGNSRAIELLLAEIYIYKGEFGAAVSLLRRLSQTDQSNEQIKKLLNIALKLPEEQTAVLGSKVVRSTTAASAAKLKPASAPAPAAEPSVLSAAQIVRQVLTLPDITGALFLNFEGLVVESEWRDSIDLNACGATLADVDFFLNQELPRASFGHVSTILIETASAVFYLIRVTNGLFLFVGDAKINLGTLRMRISALVNNYKAH